MDALPPGMITRLDGGRPPPPHSYLNEASHARVSAAATSAELACCSRPSDRRRAHSANTRTPVLLTRCCSIVGCSGALSKPPRIAHPLAGYFEVSLDIGRLPGAKLSLYWIVISCLLIVEKADRRFAVLA